MIKGIIENLVKFVKETRAETKKVVWPDKRYIAVATVIILILVIITSLYLMGVDFILSRIFGFLLK